MSRFNELLSLLQSANSVQITHVPLNKN